MISGRVLLPGGCFAEARRWLFEEKACSLASAKHPPAQIINNSFTDNYLDKQRRAVATLILSVVVALAASFLFVYPSILQQADNYNAQSIYKNTDIDFIVPEPSFEQVKELPGTNGIDKIFPFFMKKTPLRRMPKGCFCIKMLHLIAAEHFLHL